MIKNAGFIAPWVSIGLFIVLPIVVVGWVVLHTYSQDAKNASIRQSMWRVFESYSTAGVKGESLSLLIDTQTADRSVRVSSGRTILGIQNPSMLVTRAGDIHFARFSDLQRDEMYDVRGDKAGGLPLIGYVATSQQSALQVASTVQDSSSEHMIYVIGNFVADFGDDAAGGIISSLGGSGELVNGDRGVHR